jgi:hypothetical protein
VFSVWVEAVNEEERDSDFDGVIDFKNGNREFLKDPDHKKEDGDFSDEIEEFDECELKFVDSFVVNEKVLHIYVLLFYYFWSNKIKRSILKGRAYLEGARHVN